jgi:hypothetical protein
LFQKLQKKDFLREYPDRGICLEWAIALDPWGSQLNPITKVLLPQRTLSYITIMKGAKPKGQHLNK